MSADRSTKKVDVRRHGGCPGSEGAKISHLAPSKVYVEECPRLGTFSRDEMSPRGSWWKNGKRGHASPLIQPFRQMPKVDPQLCHAQPKLPPLCNSRHKHTVSVHSGKLWRTQGPPPCTSILRDPHGDVDAADSRGRSNSGQHSQMF